MQRDNSVEWKNIPGFDDRYFVSDDGRVWSDYKCGYMTQYDSCGYRICHIKKGNGRETSARIHRLVAIAFLNSSKKKYVNHIDGNKANNNVNNLEWVTASENVLHSVYELDNKQNPKRGRVRLTEQQRKEIIQMKNDGYKVNDILERFNISTGLYIKITNPVKKKRKYKPKKITIEEGESIKPIPGYEYYYAGSLGNIYSEKYGIKLKQIQQNGYLVVRLHNYDNGKCHLAHRLIALTFLGNPPQNKTQVNHKNKIKTDNRVCNLEWVSRKENLKHGMFHTRTIDNDTIIKARSLYDSREFTLVQISKLLNASETSVSRIVHCKGRFSEILSDENSIRWKTIPGFNNYEISDTGKVWSKRYKKFMSLWESNSGYLCVDLVENGKRKHKKVSRLVLLTFSENQPNVNFDVFHKDGNIKNNNLSNLKYCSRGETIKRGRHKHALNDNEIDEIRKMHKSKKYTLKELREYWNLSQGGLCAIIYYSGIYKNRGSF